MLANLDRGNAMSGWLPVGIRGRKPQWSAEVTPAEQ
jgi:hypothetical protein